MLSTFPFYRWENWGPEASVKLLVSESREGNGTPLQYFCLENPMDRGAWKTAVLGVAEGWAWLNDFTFTFHFHALEKEMATHSSVLAWRIPGMGEPGGLPSMGSHRVGHDWSDLAAAAAWDCLACWLWAAADSWVCLHWLSESGGFLPDVAAPRADGLLIRK